MRSSNIKYLPEIDHLRAFAALLIIIYHGLHLYTWEFRFQTAFEFTQWATVTNPLQAFLLEGHTAVAFFMVLSGFIFTLGCYQQKISYTGFIRNRFLRTYPLFLFMLVLGIGIYPDNFDWRGLFQSVFFLANYPGALSLGSFSAMFWAIAIEWQFYLLFPLLIWVLNRFGATILVSIIAIMIAIRMFNIYPGDNLHFTAYMTIWGRIDQFLIGILLGAYYQTSFKAGRLLDWGFGLAVVILIASMSIYNQLGGWPVQADWKFIWPTWEGLIWAFIILTYCSFSRHVPQLISRVLVAIGTISYSLYLIHFLVINELITRQLLVQISNAPMWNALANTFLVALPITLLVSAITYRWIEKPFLLARGKYKL